MMSLSSDYCLKRISEQVKEAGYGEVSDSRIREACLENNFEVIAATNKLIREEQLKISLEDLCVKMGQNPNKKLIRITRIIAKIFGFISCLFFVVFFILHVIFDDTTASTADIMKKKILYLLRSQVLMTGILDQTSILK